jgi:hypothetical protein
MNEHSDDDLLAAHIGRALRPAPLPGDLRHRLASPPARSRRILPIRFWAPAAGLAAAIVCLCFLWPERKGPSTTVSVQRRDSTLIGSKSLAFVRQDGRWWEIVERRWRDEENLLHSASPLVVVHQAERREIVPVPVQFD